jgi:hypothetical protein
MNNVHEDEPVLFHTRWALSYLRGPLTREQIARLTADREPRDDAASARPAEVEAANVPAAGTTRPVVPPKIDEGFLPVTRSLDAGQRLVYRPALLGVAGLHYANARADVDLWETVALLSPLRDEGSSASPWGAAVVLDEVPPDLDAEPEAEATFAALPPHAFKPASYVRWSKTLKNHLYRHRPLRLLRCRDPRSLSRPGQAEGEFRAQLRQLRHEERDLSVEKLRKRYAPKLSRLQERIRKAEQRIERERSQYKQQKLQSALSVGATLLGALFGRKVGSVGNVGRATTAARGMGRAARERGDIARAEESREALEQELRALEDTFEEALAGLRDEAALETECEEMLVRPRKADLSIERVVLVWTPWRFGPEGIAEPASS